MDPAYYVAAGSLKARSFQLETLSNNLANASTVGYKSERSFFSVFNKAAQSTRNLPLTPVVNSGTVLGHRGTNFQQGPSRPTQRSLDVAIEGNAFFVVRTPQGNRITRDGRFQLGQGGELQSLDGAPILGKNGSPIRLNPAQGEVSIQPDGTLQQGGITLGQLELKAYQNPLALPRSGGNRWDATGQQESPVQATLAQGYLEQSGVDVASLMVDMIQLNRLFELSMKVASTLSNDLDARSINDIAGGR